MTALFITAKYLKLPKRPYIRDWLYRLWYSQRMEYHAAVKREEDRLYELIGSDF